MDSEQSIDISYLTLKITDKGKSVFANRNFEPNAFIIEFRGKIYTMEEYKKRLNPKNNHYLQISENLFLGPTRTPDNYINHSCNPNAGIKIFGNSVLLFAIKHIHKGEEITFDYSTTMAEDYWEMDCRCGSKNCRGKIRDFKHLPSALQEKYIRLGIVPDFVLRHSRQHLQLAI
ncbi:MAG: SET domain-containing protein-lysine N-methyltransferase [Spirochaetes bacterium]|nr:SET domain-containing protein-lysine N-methyltransferase [Spirochaetota bacterium]